MLIEPKSFHNGFIIFISSYTEANVSNKIIINAFLNKTVIYIDDNKPCVMLETFDNPKNMQDIHKMIAYLKKIIKLEKFI